MEDVVESSSIEAAYQQLCLQVVWAEVFAVPVPAEASGAAVFHWQEGEWGSREEVKGE